MAERAGGGTGEQGLESGGRAPGKSGPSVGAAPGWSGSHPAHGRRRGSARGRYPPARSWLTEAGPAPERLRRTSWPERQDGRGPKGAHQSRKARPDAVRRTPQQSAERRDGRRIRSWYQAILRSALPRGGSRVRRPAPAPVGALLPSFFREEQNKTKGAPAPSSTGRRSVG